MSDAEDLDEALRTKLLAAAELAHANPRTPRHAQLSAVLARESRSLRTRWRVQTGALALGLAAAAAAAIWLWPREDSSMVAHDAPSAPRCALPQAVSITTLTEGAAGKQQLALGRFGALIASADSQLSIESASPCLLGVFLQRGELAGDLTNLKPAELRVRTPYGSVVVRGTRFSVRADAELEVVLLSGRVDIEDDGTHVLEPQHVFRKTGKHRSTAAVQAAQAAHLAELLRTSPTTSAAPAASAAALDRSAVANDRHPPAQTSASELLARAESERRRGQLDQARALYRQASTKYHDDDAEVALLRWVRMELDARAFGSAQRVLRDHARRFADGKLKAEAAWLGISILREQGKADSARNAARRLLAQFPEAPQADAARQWLAQP